MRQGLEIISPGDRASEIQEKIAQWLAGGAAVLLALYPASQGVIIWRASGASPMLHGDDEVDAEPALPGFRCQARDFFRGQPGSSKR